MSIYLGRDNSIVIFQPQVEDSSATAVPELFDPPDELSIDLLQTERTTANVHTSNSDQRRFFHYSDMRDPLIEVNKHPPTPEPFLLGCTVEWSRI